MVHATCSALHCLSSSKINKDLKFHQFPHDAERRKVWITACMRSDILEKDWDFFKNKHVCSKHFLKCMYSKRKNLKKFAFPILDLPNKPLNHEAYTQTWESIKSIKSHQDTKELCKPRDNVSIMYVMPVPANKQVTASQTQTDESILYIRPNLETAEEIIQADISEINTDKIIYAINSELEMSKTFKEGETCEDSIQNDVLESVIMADIDDHEMSYKQIKEQCVKREMAFKESAEEGETSRTQTEESMQCDEPEMEVEEDILEPRVSRTQTDQSTQCDMPETIIEQNKIFRTQPEQSLPNNEQLTEKNKKTLYLKIDQITQTEKLMIFKSQINKPTVNCVCPKTPKLIFADHLLSMTLGQFLKACDNYLPPVLSSLVRNQIHFEQVTGQFNPDTWNLCMPRKKHAVSRL